jgi:primosomal protein N' (replication factor Y)
MNFYLIAPTVRVHRRGYFTYHSEEELSVGCVVRVEVGKKHLSGVVVKQVKKPKFATKPVLRVIETTPIPKPILNLALWLEEYYSSPVSSVWQTLLPRGLEKNRRQKNIENNQLASRPKQIFQLNSSQKNAIKQILNNSKITSLLQGVTGAGKTAVYIEIAKKVIAKNKSVIVLVPEISLTPQLVAEFALHFPDIITTHSQITESQRHLIWQKCLNSQKPQVVIGPRSALFMPLKSVGLIVIDEFHEPSFKQEQSPRYSALRAARVLASWHNSLLVLGSATPSVTERFLADKSSDKALVRIDKTAREVKSPTIISVDLRDQKNFSRNHIFSTALIKAIEETLDRKKQVLLFHNRRGSAPYTLCEKCGWTSLCPKCNIPLVLHNDHFALLCHTCGYRTNVPKECPECKSLGIIHKGIGTKRIAEEIRNIFPKSKIARFDGDSTKEERFETNYQKIHDGEIDIIIGTQIVSKGLDLPHLSTVGIIQADSGLVIPDYTSEERVFQLISQTMGRVGRRNELNTIVIQSFKPDHPAIQAALRKDYDGFYGYAIEKRQQALFPPFRFLLKLTCSYSSEKAAQNAAKKLYREINNSDSALNVSPPAPAFYEKIGSSYRWQLIIKSKSRKELQKIIELIPQSHWQADLDPVSLL